MSEYLDKLSGLLGDDIQFLDNKKIEYNNQELNIDSAQDAILAAIRE